MKQQQKEVTPLSALSQYSHQPIHQDEHHIDEAQGSSKLGPHQNLKSRLDQSSD